PRDRVLDVRCQWISPISTRNVEGEESLNADDAHSKEPLLPLSSPRLRVRKRLSPLLDRLDRELGRMSANAPLDSIALAALDLLHTPAHLVQIVRAVTHCCRPGSPFVDCRFRSPLVSSASPPPFGGGSPY